MSVIAEGTQTASIGTRHVLATISTPGDYIYNIDMNVMLSGDATRVQIANKITSGGTVKGYVDAPFEGAQPVDEAITTTIPFRVEYSAEIAVKQTAGTGRSYEWSLWKID